MKDYDGLTEEDKKNLEFLLNASPETLADWAAKVSEDDLDYATELLQMLQLRIIDIVAVQDPKLTQANEMLSKYSLT
jgi:succinate dehydrogenase flavin-adding protein (antitoxin of CptAB toxin-antitoxin module)